MLARSLGSFRGFGADEDGRDGGGSGGDDGAGDWLCEVSAGMEQEHLK